MIKSEGFDYHREIIITKQATQSQLNYINILSSRLGKDSKYTTDSFNSREAYFLIKAMKEELSKRKRII